MNYIYTYGIIKFMIKEQFQYYKLAKILKTYKFYF